MDCFCLFNKKRLYKFHNPSKNEYLCTPKIDKN